MYKLTTLFFIILFTSFVAYAQDAAKSQGVNDVNTPVSYQSDGTSLFMDDMNGNNTVAGIQARGWFFDDVDGAGTTTTFQGNITVFPAYEGPDTGYIGQNFNGAFGGGLLIDQWLISPQVTVEAGDTLKFWHRSPDASIWPDPLQVWVSTTGGSTSGAFDVQLASFNSSTAGWQQYIGNFTTSGTVRFAVRYYTTNGGPGGSQSDYVGLDLFEVISGGGGGYSFFDNFDSYVAGQLLAQQNPTEWTTWSNLPGSAEDVLVTNARSASPPNSIVVLPNDDLVRLHGDLTSGKWYTGFLMYIQTGKAGYWNMLSDFTFSTGGYWAFECYFDVGGGGRLATGDGTAIFSWITNTWQWVEVVIDLDLNQTQFWIGGSVGGTLVHQWAWTNGATTGTGPLIIDATDFFGATANDEMYVDDFFIGPVSLTPVELTSFGASVNTSGHVVLNWTTGTEINNLMFEVERSIGNNEFHTVGYVNGHGTTSEPQEYSYTDASAVSGKYYYRLKQIDFSGAFEYSNVVEIDVQGPIGFDLAQNYPNPFNPSTIIDFSIAEAGMVKLAVYNLLGEEIQVIRNEYMEPGFHQVTFNALNLPSGMYIYKLETASYTQARKMMLMK